MGRDQATSYTSDSSSQNGDRPTTPFARIPEHVVLDEALRPHLAVLCLLAIRSDYTTGLTDYRCSTRTLATDLNLALRTVRWHLACLVELGAIVLERPRRGVRADQYRLAWLGASARPHRALDGSALSTTRQPHRALDDADAELVRGHTAPSARPHRALERGHTAHNSEEELIPDARARDDVGDSDNVAVRLSMGFIDQLVRDAATDERDGRVRQVKPRRPRAGPR
jgi:hypothetical protein